MSLTRFLKLPSLTIIFLIVASCSTPYFGYSHAEWNKLSEIEQETVKAEYEKIIASRETLKHDDKVDESKQIILRRAENR